MIKWMLLFVRNLLSRRATRLIRRRYAFLILLVVVITIYIHGSNYIQGTYMWKNPTGKCKNAPEEEATLLSLIQISHTVLQKLKIDYFLAYGSLWGAIRFNNPLPWDYDYDFGILYEDLLKISEEDLINEFKKHGIKISYHYYAGNYKVEKGSMTGDLMIFRDYYNNGIMRRIGLESWLLFIHYRLYHQFPSRLVEKPLPKMKFASMDSPVPREGIEIQKYLYPKNWWKVVTPAGCTISSNNTIKRDSLPLQQKLKAQTNR